MRTPSFSTVLQLALGLSAAVPAFGAAIGKRVTERSTTYTREYLSDLVDEILASILAHDPYTLPLASVYKATENSHPAALHFFTAYRTIVEAGSPSLLALDTTQGSAYFALDVSEGDTAHEAILRGRVQVVDWEITELELFLNRGRGDHGFSFSSDELAANYAELMSPASNRTKASRETLYELSYALFASDSNFSVTVDDDCQFTELGWHVVDPGTYGNSSTDALGCSWPSTHPLDSNARTGLVIDEELGFVITSGNIPGTVYPYGNVSAFIPNIMTAAQEVQVEYIEAVEGTIPLLAPLEATGDTLEVLQYYNDALQAMQINVYLSGPNMTSAWV